MAYTVGKHTSYNPQTETPGSLHQLQERWGSELECMTYEQKIVMRAALADYISNKPVWKVGGSSITLIDCCIETAGVDWGVWDADPELVEAIQDCSSLHESDIEGLIAALTEQIIAKVYASRLEEQTIGTLY